MVSLAKVALGTKTNIDFYANIVFGQKFTPKKNFNIGKLSGHADFLKLLIHYHSTFVEFDLGLEAG